MTEHEPTDSELLLRVGHGDGGAFETLYRRYSRPVFGLALRRLGDRTRAEEAVQETFTSVWRSARTYKPERGPGAPWLYAVARNAIVDGARTPRRPRRRRPARRAVRRRRPAWSGPSRAGLRGACTARSRSCPETERTVVELGLLEGAVAERDRGAPADPARHRQDANAERLASARGSAGGRVLVSGPPNFDELIGPDLPPDERERLRRVHELLVAAGPPPEMPRAARFAPGARAPASSGRGAADRRRARACGVRRGLAAPRAERRVRRAPRRADAVDGRTRLTPRR